LIGVDTNVLLRAAVRDDPAQSGLARRFLQDRSSTDPAVVNVVVLAELVWVLRSKYRAGRQEIAAFLEAIASSDAYMLTSRDAVLNALQDFKEGLGEFTDVLIAELNRAAGCRATVTFDRDAPQQAGFSLLR
jgi:predicted nucleic-acid-binding protein